MPDLIACGFGQNDLRARVGRWRRLIEDSARKRVVTDDGARISFHAHPATIRELRALVAAERECCDGPDWTASPCCASWSAPRRRLVRWRRSPEGSRR